jgi:hypothetical protein
MQLLNLVIRDGWVLQLIRALRCIQILSYVQQLKVEGQRFLKMDYSLIAKAVLVINPLGFRPELILSTIC